MPEMREELNRMRERQATSEADLRNLSEDVAKLTNAVVELKEAIDRSRGALWVISGCSVVVGWVASLLNSAWFKH